MAAVAPDGQTYDNVVTFGTSVIAYDNTGSGSGTTGPLGIRGIWHRGSLVSRSTLAGGVPTGNGNMRTRINFFLYSDDTGGFNVGAESGDTRSWNAATRTMTITRPNQIRLVVAYSDFTAVGSEDQILVTALVENLHPSKTLDWASTHLVRVENDVNTSAEDVQVGSAPSNPPISTFRATTGRWMTLSGESTIDDFAVGLSRHSIGGGVEEYAAAVIFGCLKSPRVSNIVDQSVNRPMALAPGGSRTVTLTVDFASALRGIQSIPGALLAAEDWAARLIAITPGGNGMSEVKDRRTVGKMTSLADDPNLVTTTNPSGWRIFQGVFDARPQQGGESLSTYQSRLNTFWTEFRDKVAIPLRDFYVNRNASGVIFWENEGGHPLTRNPSNQRYIGDPRWTYFLAPELAYRPTVGNPSNLTIWQLFAKVFTDAGLAYGYCLRGRFGEGGELQAVIGGVPYRFSELPVGSTLADVTSFTRAGGNGWSSYQAFCDWMVDRRAYVFDEIGATYEYHDVNDPDDYEVIPGTSLRRAHASQHYFRTWAAANRPVLRQKFRWFPEYVRSNAYTVGGFDFHLTNVGPLGDSWTEDALSEGLSRGAAGYPGAGVWYINQTNGDEANETPGGKERQRDAAYLATEIKKGSIVGYPLNQTPSVYDVPKNAYVRAYGEISIPPTGIVGSSVTMTLCHGIDRVWCDGLRGATHSVNWGDGTTSVVNGPALTASHTYSSSGTFSVSVTTSAGANDGAASYTTSASITVQQGTPPMAKIGIPRILVVTPHPSVSTGFRVFVGSELVANGESGDVFSTDYGISPAILGTFATNSIPADTLPVFGNRFWGVDYSSLLPIDLGPGNGTATTATELVQAILSGIVTAEAVRYSPATTFDPGFTDALTADGPLYVDPVNGDVVCPVSLPDAVAPVITSARINAARTQITLTFSKPILPIANSLAGGDTELFADAGLTVPVSATPTGYTVDYPANPNVMTVTFSGPIPAAADLQFRFTDDGVVESYQAIPYVTTAVAVSTAPESYWPPAPIITPQGAPNAPTSPTATLTDNQIVVSWTRADDANIRRYRIERATDAGFTTQLCGIASTLSTGRSIVDLAIQPGVTYYYRVFSESAYGLSNKVATSGVSVPTVSATVNYTARPLTSTSGFNEKRKDFYIISPDLSLFFVARGRRGWGGMLLKVTNPYPTPATVQFLISSDNGASDAFTALTLRDEVGGSITSLVVPFATTRYVTVPATVKAYMKVTATSSVSLNITDSTAGVERVEPLAP